MNNKMAITTYLSTITLNINGLNAPIKRQEGWRDKKTRPLHMLPTGDPLQIERYTQTESKGMEKDILYKWKQTNKKLI